MRIHILGICGTFMGGVAALASAAGHRVTGSDANIYPPMSTQLDALGITVHEGWEPGVLDAATDMVVVGNALSRGNPMVEHVLSARIPYTSGPQWLAEQVLAGRHVIAVAGTHGKTTVSAMVAWILECAGLAPGFLIGGVPVDFDHSARLGGSDRFVVEADEYDTAFFDKRSKFVHYRPRTAVLNNLEYDHADIFPDLPAIERQFHHFIRTVPGDGLVISNGADPGLERVLEMGCWTPVERFDGEADGWQARVEAEDGSRFAVSFDGAEFGTVDWSHHGAHNIGNALAAIAAARHAGVPPAESIEALGSFGGVRRRMELRGTAGGVSVYDDFAHHPTEIATTLDGMRKRVGDARIIAVLDLRSNTMRMGVHAARLVKALDAADIVVIHAHGAEWDVPAAMARLGDRARTVDTPDAVVDALVPRLRAGDHVLVMSNGGFGGVHGKLLDALRP